ncbi:MAG: helix-turn-helix domain-containing protein [Alphaproteobacteria bacterium]
MVIGNNLRVIRETRNYSQADLAKSVGITFQQIQKYEKGINRISASKLLEISNALKTDIKDFYRGLLNEKDYPPINFSNKDILKLSSQIASLKDPKLIDNLKVIISTMAK